MALLSGVHAVKKIIAEIKRISNNSLYPKVYCLDRDGFEDDATSQTLCDALWELRGEPGRKLSELIECSFAEKRAFDNSDLPDMSINEKLIWVRPSFSASGGIYISNENVPELSIDEGTPQRFTPDQVKTVAVLVSDFSKEIAEQGQENLAGRRFEVDFPDT